MSSYVEVATGLLEEVLVEVPSTMKEYKAVAVAASTSSSACFLWAWRKFLNFCETHKAHPLPPKVSTIICYFSYICTQFSFSSILTVRAAIKHFYSFDYPREPSPTDLRSVAKVVRGFEGKFKKASVKKNGFSAEVVNNLVRFLSLTVLKFVAFRTF